MTEAVFAAEPTRLLIAALIRASVGAAVVAMTMAAEIMAAMPGVAEWYARSMAVRLHSAM